MTKLKLTKVAEVSMIDQFMAVMTFLESMGIETSELTSMDVASMGMKNKPDNRLVPSDLLGMVVFML